MKIYDIKQEIEDIIATCNEDGELTDENMARLTELVCDRNEKIENTALFYKNLLSDVAELKAEEKKLKERRESKEKHAERLKSFLSTFVEDKFETPRVAISFRKSESVNIIDEAEIDSKYFTIPTPVVNKTLIKAALKDGEIILGAAIVENKNIQIR
jgi:hypothetical protein